MISLKNIFGKKQQVMNDTQNETVIQDSIPETVNTPDNSLPEEYSINQESISQPVYDTDVHLNEIDDTSYLLTDPRVVGWLSVQEQELLFSGLLLFYNPSQHSILDVGCGRADLYSYIKNLFQLDEYELYTGMDMNPNMLDLASKKYPEVNLISMDILKDDVDDTFDWVVGSGLFNLNDHPDMQEYSKTVIDKMLSKANIGVAVNMLVGVPEELSDNDKAQLVVHDPSVWLEYLINKYNRVICRHDYMSGDVTFIIFK